MFNIEPTADFYYCAIVQIQRVVRYDSFWHTITTYDFLLQELADRRLCDIGVRSSLYPFGELVNNHEYETMPI